MSEESSLQELYELAALAGVRTEYYDLWRTLHRAEPDVLRQVLSAMGYGNVSASLRELRARPWNRLLEPVLVVSQNAQPPLINAYFPLAPDASFDDIHVSLSVEGEDGLLESHEMRSMTPAEEREIEDVRHVRIELPNDTRRPCGYYHITALVSAPGFHGSAVMKLIVTPDSAYIPAAQEGGADLHCWGLTVNLYGLRSAENWGVGDLGDLRALMEGAAAQGAGFVGINPLHAIPNTIDEGISPYSPVSRLYMNYLYIDMAHLPCGLSAHLNRKAIAGELKSARSGEFIDYEAVAQVKLHALRTLFDGLSDGTIGKCSSDALESFDMYQAREGDALRCFSTFMALAQRFNSYTWRAWPPEYHAPDSSAVMRFRAHRDRDVRFHAFIQWVLDEQLEAARQAAGQADSAMPVGLYGDLAVGSSSGGCDAWQHRHLFAPGMSIGAPPDDFSPTGQDWLFPPMIPRQLRETGYELLIDVLRKNLRHAGAMRIDHALGLFRLFWVPSDRGPRHGVYVEYPWEELLRIVALESVRARAVIIAEDLGTVDDEVRRRLHDFGMLSYRLLYFERDWEANRFLRPEEYPALALAAVNTHDLPTLRGYCAGRDIDVRHGLGQMDEAAAQAAHQQRREDCVRMCEAFALEGSPQEPSYEILNEAAHGWLARTPCLLSAVSLDDVLGSLEQQNLPGVVPGPQGYPCWQRRYPAVLQDVLRQDGGALAAMSALMRSSGRCR